MHITIVGTGHVGRALAQAWRKAGHQITLAARNPSDSKVADLKQAGFSVAGLDAAAKDAAVIVLAVPWSGVTAALAALGPLDGKILIDATNPIAANLDLAL